MVYVQTLRHSSHVTKGNLNVVTNSWREQYAFLMINTLRYSKLLTETPTAKPLSPQLLMGYVVTEKMWLDTTELDKWFPLINYKPKFRIWFHNISEQLEEQPIKSSETYYFYLVTGLLNSHTYLSSHWHTLINVWDWRCKLVFLFHARLSSKYSTGNRKMT